MTATPTPLDAYDPFASDVIADPFPHYAWMREHAPVFHNATHELWALTRYDDVRAALRNHDVFSSTEGVGSERRPVPMMISYDPPDHTRLRRMVQRDFTPKAITTVWEPVVERLVDELVDDLIERGTADLSETVSYPLPVALIADILGVPRDRRPDFKRWSDNTIDALGGGLDPEASYAAELGIIEFAQYCLAQIQDRRAHPGDDLISLLLEPRSGEVLSDDELVSFVVLLLVAGNETTTNLIGNMVLTFMRHPDQWTRLKTRPDLVPAAIEEVLRYESPIQGFFRNTLVDHELHGVTIPAGAKVMMLYGAANRDERHFVDPDEFRVDRARQDHLAFGAGIHLCLGAPLARLEGTYLLRRLLERVDHFEPAGPVVRTRNPLLRGVRHLPVTAIEAET